jgi:hypothetical protein
MAWVSVNEAAEELGMSGGGVRYRMKTGVLESRWTNVGWQVHLNGDEPVPEMHKAEEGNDPLIEFADELISLGRKLKKVIKEHDAEVRRDTIVDFAATLAETAKRR